MLEDPRDRAVRDDRLTPQATEWLSEPPRADLPSPHPWRVRGDQVVDRFERAIVTATVCEVARPQALASLPYMAAALELYAACMDSLSFFEDDEHPQEIDPIVWAELVKKRLRKAISRAKEG